MITKEGLHGCFGETAPTPITSTTTSTARIRTTLTIIIRITTATQPIRTATMVDTVVTIPADVVTPDAGMAIAAEEAPAVIKISKLY